jgi:hypothetical protein
MAISVLSTSDLAGARSDDGEFGHDGCSTRRGKRFFQSRRWLPTRMGRRRRRDTVVAVGEATVVVGKRSSGGGSEIGRDVE